MILRHIANQFRQPTGALGHLWGAAMNRGNARMIAGTVEALDVQPKHQVLEIGFGGGASLDLLLKLTSEGHVAGTELSEILLAQARRRFADAIHHRRLDLVFAPVEMLPFENARFDRVCTINTIYFWTDPTQRSLDGPQSHSGGRQPSKTGHQVESAKPRGQMRGSVHVVSLPPAGILARRQ